MPAKLILLSSVSSAPETSKQHAKQRDTPLRGSKHTHCFKINLGCYNLSQISSFLFHTAQRFQKVGCFSEQSGDFEAYAKEVLLPRYVQGPKHRVKVVKESYLKNELTESQSTKGAKLFCVRLLTNMKTSCTWHRL